MQSQDPLIVGFYVQLAPDGAERDLSPPEVNWSLFGTFLKFFFYPNTGFEDAKDVFFCKRQHNIKFLSLDGDFLHKEQFAMLYP